MSNETPGVLIPVGETEEPTAQPAHPIPVPAETMPWWKSKVIWLNIAALLLAVLVPVIDSPLTPDSLDKILLYGVAGLNFILRFFSNPAALTVKGKTAVEYLRKA